MERITKQELDIIIRTMQTMAIENGYYSPPPLDSREMFCVLRQLQDSLQEPRYTVDEIRAAFWKTFHESGENWFNYLGSEEENSKDTEYSFNEFLDYLEA